MEKKNKPLFQGIAEGFLNCAIENYYENPCWDTFCRILDQLINAWVFNFTAIRPFEIEEGRGQYKTFQTPDYGYAFIVYTGPDKNPEMKDAEIEAFVSWRQVLSTAAENINCTGIVINPYSGRQALVWVNPVYIRLVIKNAQKKLEKKGKERAETDSDSSQESCSK